MQRVTITADLLDAVGIQPKFVDKYETDLRLLAGQYCIDTPLRVAHFLGQVMHESGDFKHVDENLNYSATALLRVFPRYFPADLARLYARNPKAIASRVYANRMGNGDERSGEGYLYRGRGLIQVTGKNNYRKLSQWIGFDCVARPDAVAEKYAVGSAVWYWTVNTINNLADRDDVKAVTRAINGGYNGIDDRIAKTNRVKRELERMAL